ncbi:MurR/RpiR family transcriptional regulator [Beduini massiliensis]|uniref:MurR/RpiR family transcriptional regulator n=1 Tax=Beduini massiliensis TaxID=1585974 RepID=UPI00059A8154|nr:hypothetical protein [Beduini massiliensis]
MDKRCTPVYFKLVDFLADCRHHDANYDIAKTLIELIHDFPDIYIEQVASRAHTSISTVTKFCKRLGYSSFKSLKEDILPYVDQSTDIQTTVDAFIKKDHLLTQSFFEWIDFTDLTHKLKEIIQHQPIVILNSSYSDPASNHLRSIFEVHHHATYLLNRDVDDVILFDLIKKQGVVLIISLTGHWLIQHQETLKQLRQNHIAYYIISADDTIDAKHLIALPKVSSLFHSYYHSSRYLNLLTITIEIALNYLN